MGKIILLMTIMIASQAMAGVYQCVNEQGAIEFRDSPCRTSLETQEFLPIQYSKTEAKAVRLQEKQLNKKMKTLEKGQTQQAKRKALEDNKSIQAEQKEKRRQQHCERVKEKILLIEDQLRAGKKLKSFNRLKVELEHHRRMKQKYCDTLRP